MSLILVVSILIRLVALAWSIALLKKVKDWRMGFLAIMLALMALRQSLTLTSSFESWSLFLSGQTNELPGLVVSVMAFLAILFLERMLAERKALELEMMQVGASEQQRIGRDLHDGIGQELTGIAYLIEALRDKLHVRSAEEASDADEITTLIKTTIVETRNIVKGLCPISAQPDAFADGLRELADSVTFVNGIPVDCECDPGVTIRDVEAANHLYFIAREAIHNAVKHSETDRISISFIDKEEAIRLEIRDYGIGMVKTSKNNTAGRGCKIMSRRAELIGGKLEYRSHPSAGLSVICHYSPAVYP
jgi:signal transduction histidine kinase